MENQEKGIESSSQQGQVLFNSLLKEEQKIDQTDPKQQSSQEGVQRQEKNPGIKSQEEEIKPQEQDFTLKNQQIVEWAQNFAPTESKTIDLSSTTYNEWSNTIRPLCQKMRVWKIHALWIGDNKQPMILHQILHIKLCNLVRIDVSGNNIQSIELLWKLHTPNLMELYIQDNKIREIKNVRRCNWPNFYFIGLGNNCILDGYWLSEANMQSLTWLGLQHQSSTHFPNDISWVVKLNTNKLNMLQMQNQNRIKQNKLNHILVGGRFPTLPEVSVP